MSLPTPIVVMLVLAGIGLAFLAWAIGGMAYWMRR
jgi:hypothetical protein